jgi:hypothetical protein
MRNKLTVAVTTTALAAGGFAATGAGATHQAPAHATAATRHVEGRVTAVNRTARTFTVRDAERGALTVKVLRSTKFEGITFASLRTGKRVDVRATRAAGVWRATKVERGDDVGDDVGANHDRNDDRGGDDRGGHGNDDGAGHH